VRERLDTVARQVAGEPRVPTLFCIQTEPIIAAGRGTLPAQLLEIAGGRNIVLEPRYPRLGLESVVAAKPALILQARMDVPSTGSELAEEAFWARWPQIPAVAAHRVVVLDAGLALRPGPRVADAAERCGVALRYRGERLHGEPRPRRLAPRWWRSSPPRPATPRASASGLGSKTPRRRHWGRRRLQPRFCSTSARARAARRLRGRGAFRCGVRIRRFA
jgi:hypothetical protein